MNVCTVLRSGGRYTPEWVARLHRQVRRFHPLVDFTVLSDQPLSMPGITALPLLHDWPGWWAKLELFADDAITRPSWFLDLDTVLLSPLPEIDTSHPLLMLSDWERPSEPNSAAMVINGETAPYHRFQEWGEAGIMASLHGDQDFIAAAVPRAIPRLQAVYPGVFWDFKAITEQPASGVVCFRGEAKPDVLPRKHWAAKAWRNA